MKKIMVVDDDVMNLKMAEFILEKNNYEVIKASSGGECLEILQNEVVDLILLDIEMPVMNGFKTLEHLKSIEQLKDIPVVFLTANIDESYNLDELGVAGYIKKPFLPPQLISGITNVIG